MEWVEEPQKRTPDGSPRQYRRDHINRSSQCWWSVEKLDRSMSMERLYELQENNMSVTMRLDRSLGSMETLGNSEHQVLDRSQRTPRKNFTPSTCLPMKGSLSTKQCKSKDGYLGMSVDHSLDRSHSRSSVEIKWSADVDISGDVYDSSKKGSPDASPRQYRRAELNRSLDVLLENAQRKPPPRVTRNQSLDMLLDARVEIGGSPTKSHETLNRSRNNLSDRFKEGSKKRDEKNSSNAWSQETFTSKVQRRQKQQTRVVRGDNGMCLEIAILCVHVCTAAVALGTVVALGIMSTRWDHQRQVCPLFVRVPPGFHIHWGNEDMTGCYTAAFLPLIIVVLSLVFAALHYSVVRIWTENYMPTLAASRTLSLLTLAVTSLEAAVALASTIILTEGFRQTCISFDLSLSWGEAPYTCRSNYNDRDFAYRLGYLHTFDLILGGLVCGWTLVILTIILVLLSVTRARLCACHCL